MVWIQSVVGGFGRFEASSAGAPQADAPWEGARMALELIEQMQPWARGIYLMPQFGRYDLAAEIVEKCK